MAALAVAGVLAGPLAAEAAGAGRPVAESVGLAAGLEALWGWVREAAAALAAADKGSSIDPNGVPTAWVTAPAEKGSFIDPNGVPAVAVAPEKGIHIDPNG
jgi:hypothetical protein